MRLHDVAATSQRVSETASRTAKIGLLADLLRRAEPDTIALVVSYLTGELLQGRVGLGGAAVRNAWPDTAQSESTLDVRTVHAAFDEIAAQKGAGSSTARVRILADLLARATLDEQRFLASLVFGELRQGALEGVMLEAIARAADVPASTVRNALLVVGSLPDVARLAFQGGAAALAGAAIRLFRPLQPMLAQAAESTADALERLERAAFDYKLDGARVQVHKSGDDVRVYSRRMNEVTEAVPEIVELVRSLPANELVLDGEAIVLGADGRPEPFQTTMRRFGRRLDVDALRAELPLSTMFFDVLHIDGAPLLLTPAHERFTALSELVPDAARVPRLVTSAPDEAAAFLRRARAAGHEGVVAKALDAGYDAGRRGGSWLKVKQVDTLDLVVLAAEWGHGRRQGWLSNLHLGARDPANGSFVMLGKTFKGLTDALLEWQTQELLARQIGREGHIVHVRPELVVEIAFEGVQRSPRYPGGVTLRFARVRRYRSDKTAAEADTIDRVRGFLP